VHRLAQKLYAEFRRADAFLPLIVESIGLEMVAEICRRQSPRLLGRPPLWLKQAKEELHERFSERISPADIAHSVGFHPVHFARMFRRYFGYSMGEYIRLRRIECASFALKSTRAPLQELPCNAAERVGRHHCTREARRSQDAECRPPGRGCRTGAAAGGNRVVLQGGNLHEDIKEALDGKKLSLVLDTVGGTSVGELAKSLKPGGSIVVYGLQSGQFPAMPPKDFIYRGLSLHGFWLINWIHNAPRTEIEKI